ncbi:MAG TPA: CYTH domain-containing protein [Candidatus Paceibacterota bacterium]|nr:CYTH domain-containing protein [Candidatus Paceibacterota bacterium]
MMQVEYEATFADIDRDEMRDRLKKAGAKLERPEYLQKRIPFNLPKEKRTEHAWARVRDEGDKITMSLKVVEGNKIEDQKEICLRVDDFEDAVQFLQGLGCKPKSYQETKRELWTLDGVEVTIHEWPFLEPFVEIEGSSEKDVRMVALKLGFAWKDAEFCAVGKLYGKKYGISE